MMQHTTQGSSRLFQRSSLIIGAVLVSLGLALCSFVPSAHAVTAAEKQAEVEEALANLTAMQESLDLPASRRQFPSISLETTGGFSDPESTIQICGVIRKR